MYSLYNDAESVPPCRTACLTGKGVPLMSSRTVTARSLRVGEHDRMRSSRLADPTPCAKDVRQYFPTPSGNSPISVRHDESGNWRLARNIFAGQIRGSVTIFRDVSSTITLD